MSLPMPPPNKFAVSGNLFFHYVWDTKDIPEVQEFPNVVVVTPQFDNLHVYGRSVTSTDPEDVKEDLRLGKQGRFLAEWFSVVCPEGELGTMAFYDVEEITAEQFSAAYERGWK